MCSAVLRWKYVAYFIRIGDFDSRYLDWLRNRLDSLGEAARDFSQKLRKISNWQSCLVLLHGKWKKNGSLIQLARWNENALPESIETKWKLMILIDIIHAVIDFFNRYHTLPPTCIDYHLFLIGNGALFATAYWVENYVIWKAKHHRI